MSGLALMGDRTSGQVSLPPNPIEIEMEADLRRWIALSVGQSPPGPTE